MRFVRRSFIDLRYAAILVFCFCSPMASQVLLDDVDKLMDGFSQTLPLSTIPNRLNTLLADKGLSQHIIITELYTDQKRARFDFRLLNRAIGGTIVPNPFDGPNRDVVWINLFMTVSEVLSLPLRSIQATGKVGECFYTLIGGTPAIVTCNTAATIGVMVPVPPLPNFQIASGKISIPTNLRFDRVPKLAGNFLKMFNRDPTISEQSDSHIVIGSHGLKNIVVSGENFWEKVSFYISNISKGHDKPLEIFIVADGYYTRALGAEPPITSYTNPFEPQYFKQLDDFTKSFGQYLRDGLSTGK
jgi:hypothetical protein